MKNACLLLLPALLGCRPPATPASLSRTDLPAKQFTFEGLTLEERRGGKTLWSGHAKSADGDMTETKVVDLVLNYHRPNTDQQYEVRAPVAVLTLAEGRATFTNVTIHDAAGRVLDAGTAHWDEKRASIMADGPVTLSAQGLEVHATAGQVFLDTGAIDIEGPIHGSLLRSHAQTR